MNKPAEKSKSHFRQVWLCLVMLWICIGVFAIPQTARADIDRQNWMKYLPDTMQISQINLPGTHDSGCCYVRTTVLKAAKTQFWSFEKQLENGLRNFDIRLGPYGSDDNIYDMKLCHGDIFGVTMNCYTGTWCTERLVLDDVLGYCEKFVTAHPSETIVLMLREEIGGDSINAKIEKIMVQLNHSIGSGNSNYPHAVAYDAGEDVPKLGEVRGKIVILCKKRYNGKEYANRLPYTDYETDYEWVKDSGSYSDPTLKLERVNGLLGLSLSWPQLYYPKKGSMDVLKDTEARLKNVLNGKESKDSVKAPMLVSTNLTAISMKTPFGDGPNNCWYYLYGNESGEKYAHFGNVNLDQRFSRLGWWQFDFPPQYHIDQLIKSNQGKTLVKYYVHVENTAEMRQRSQGTRLLMAYPYLDDDPDNPYRLCRAVGKYWELDTDQKYYVQEFESFVADQSILFTDLFISGSDLHPTRLTRKTNKSDPNVIRIDDYFTFESPDTPNEMEIWVEWNKNVLDTEIPRTLVDFKQMLFEKTVFTAYNQNGRKESVTGTDFRNYKYVPETRTSVMKIAVPLYDKDGYWLNYTDLDMPETLGNYRLTYSANPDYKQFTIRVSAAWVDGYTQVPVNIEWYDGNDQYGLRNAAVEYLKTEFAFHNKYTATDMNAKKLDNWQLANMEFLDEASKAIFTLKEHDEDGKLEAYAHFVQFEEKSSEYLLANLHYQVNEHGIFRYAPHMKNPKYEEHRLITVENFYLMGTLNVKVTWVDDDASGRPEDGVSASLSGVDGGFLNIAPSSGNVWVKNNVPCRAFDSNNKEVSFDSSFLALPGTYTPVPGYNVKVVVDMPVSPGELPVYNVEYIMTKKVSVPISGTVTWHDGGYHFAHNKPTLRVIQQYLIDPSLGPVEDNIVEVEIPADELQIVWKGDRFSFTDNTCFPKYKSNGSPCTYLIEADRLQDYDINVDEWNMTATRLITLYGSADWEDPTHRPMAIQPVIRAIQNDRMIGSPVTAEKYEYAIKNLPISDENDRLYCYDIYAYLPGLENDERIYWIYSEPEQSETDGGNVRINAAIHMKTSREDAKVPVKLTLQNADPTTEPETFSFMIEGETGKGQFSDVMMLYNGNGFTDSFDLNADLFEDNKTYKFQVKQWNISKPNWKQDTHIEEVTVTIRYLNGVRVPQVDMGGKTALEFTNARIEDTEYIAALGHWIDGGIEGLHHPDRAPIHLLADGDTVRSAELTAENDYLFIFSNLPIYRDDQAKTPIVYTLQADAPAGYIATVTGDAATGFKVDYTLSISVSGSVDWENSKRPANNQPMIQLLRNGQMVGAPVAETDFAYMFEEQPIADRNNDVYEYSIVASLDGFDVTVSYLPVERSIMGDVIANAIIRKRDTSLDVEIPVQLTLKDDNPATEPESFFFLMEGENKEGTYQGILTLDSDIAFTGKFVLDGSLFENNQSYTYTIKQINGDSPVWDYDIHTAAVIITIRAINGKRVAQVDMGGDTAVRFINTRLNNTEEITVTARWNNGDRKTCPTHTAIRLYGDGVQVRREILTQAGNWTCTFAGLPLYRESLPRAAVEYTVDYDVPEGYTAILSGDSNAGFVVTYTAMVSVSGSVDWVDGKRPANNQPSVQLLRNDQLIGQSVEEQNFKYAFENLPIADESNVPYRYSIVATLDGFDTIISYQPIICDANGNVTANAVISKIDLPVQAEIPVKLTLSGVDASEVTESFCFIIERSDVNSPFRTLVELNRENNYTDFFVLDAGGYEAGKPYSFTVHQLKGDKHYWIYDERIADITITIVYINGKPVARVDTDEKGLTFRNVYCAVPGSISIELDKQVVNLLAGIAVPDQQTFRFELLKPQADGKTTRVSTASVTGEGHVQFPPITLTDIGTYTYVVREYSEDVPGWIFDHTGYPVKVTVSDVDGQLLATTDVIPTITNTYETTMLNVGVKVNWVDNNKKKKPIPDHIRIDLFADEKSVGHAYSTAESNWVTGFAEVPEYRRSGTTRAIQMVPIVYTLTAETVDGFTVNITGEAKSGYVVTYTAIQDVPKTGDRMNLPLTAGMLLLSASLLFVLVHKRQRY